MNAHLVADFRKLVIWLHDKHKPLLLDRLDEGNRELYNELLVTFPSADDRILESLLPSAENGECDFIRDKCFLYLSPDPGEGTDTKLGFLPFIAIKCNFDRQFPEVRVGVAMALRHMDRKPRILGFRFEAPEGLGGGLHDFYHAQIIQSFVSDGRPSIPLNHAGADMGWLPMVQPSMPLDAHCPITLFLSVLVSLYGFKYLDVVSRNLTLSKEYFREMRCWEFQPNYFRIKGSGRDRFVRVRLRDEAIVKARLKSALKIKGSFDVLDSSLQEYQTADAGMRIEL
jgi:hypothetical protein